MHSNTIPYRVLSSSLHLDPSSIPSNLKQPTLIHSSRTYANSMKNPVTERFTEFYEKWVWKLEEILLDLELSKQVIKTEQELQILLSKVTSHLKEYYTVKWASAHEDVLVFFSPPWLSPLENAYLWMTGWKPSVIFKLLEKHNANFVVTKEQARKIHELRKRIRMEEEKIEREMERHQVAMADRKMFELVKLTSRPRNGLGEYNDAVVEMALKGILAGLERVVKASDCVRLKTLKGVLDLLTPMQSLDFLAANIAMHLRLRQWGKNKRDMPLHTQST